MGNLKAVLEGPPPEAVKEFYQEKDGKFYLQTEGLVAESAHAEIKTKLAEFRDNNIELLRQVRALEDAKTQLAKFQGIDPEEYKALKDEKEKLNAKGIKSFEQVGQLISDAVTKATGPLTEKLATMEVERTKLAEKMNKATLRDVVSTVTSKAGIKAKAMPYLIPRAEDLFQVVDGTVIAKEGVFSSSNPANPLTVEEWVASLSKTDDFLFEASAGGGATGQLGTPKPRARQLLNPTPAEKGRFMKEIASGEVEVVVT